MIWLGGSSPVCRQSWYKDDDSLGLLCAWFPKLRMVLGMKQNPDRGRLRQGRAQFPGNRSRVRASQDWSHCSRAQAASLFLHVAFILSLITWAPSKGTIQIQAGRRENGKGKKLSRLYFHQEKPSLAESPILWDCGSYKWVPLSSFIRITSHGHLLLQGSPGNWKF